MDCENNTIYAIESEECLSPHPKFDAEDVPAGLTFYYCLHVIFGSDITIKPTKAAVDIKNEIIRMFSSDERYAGNEINNTVIGDLYNIHSFDVDLMALISNLININVYLVDGRKYTTFCTLFKTQTPNNETIDVGIGITGERFELINDVEQLKKSLTPIGSVITNTLKYKYESTGIDYSKSFEAKTPEPQYVKLKQGSPKTMQDYTKNGSGSVKEPVKPILRKDRTASKPLHKNTVTWHKETDYSVPKKNSLYMCMIIIEVPHTRYDEIHNYFEDNSVEAMLKSVMNEKGLDVALKLDAINVPAKYKCDENSHIYNITFRTPSKVSDSTLKAIKESEEIISCAMTAVRLDHQFNTGTKGKSYTPPETRKREPHKFENKAFEIEDAPQQKPISNPFAKRNSTMPRYSESPTLSANNPFAKRNTNATTTGFQQVSSEARDTNVRQHNSPRKQSITQDESSSNMEYLLNELDIINKNQELRKEEIDSRNKRLDERETQREFELNELKAKVDVNPRLFPPTAILDKTRSNASEKLNDLNSYNEFIEQTKQYSNEDEEMKRHIQERIHELTNEEQFPEPPPDIDQDQPGFITSRHTFNNTNEQSTQPPVDNTVVNNGGAIPKTTGYEGISSRFDRSPFNQRRSQTRNPFEQNVAMKALINRNNGYSN